jgi:threonyl-tRNA synthetase
LFGGWVEKRATVTVASEKMAELITVTFLDGSVKKTSKGTTVGEALPQRGESGEVIAALVDGKPVDLAYRLESDATIGPVTFEMPGGKEVYRHSSSHIMAQAVKDLFPTAKLTIGPAIEEGFYYDFAYERPFTPEDLQKIATRIQEIIRADRPFVRMEMSRRQAMEFFKERGEDYKCEMIEGFVDEMISAYDQGGLVDLCRGPHVPSTGHIHAIKLLTSAGAYWRGDERNPMLQRIYGTSFPTQKALDAYLHTLEEIKKRDHRKVGKELELISMTDEVGPGLILWLPKGSTIRLQIENFWREQHVKHGYELVYSPHVARLDLWKTSGHTEFYRENMFAPMQVEATEYQLKPMNCPFHIMIYKSRLRSYRDLPRRYAELGTVYRYERSGVLHGLMRVRGFTQDDAHLFCRPEQIEAEVVKVLDFTFFVLKTFGFSEYQVYVSTRPEKAVGSEGAWGQATAALEAALHSCGVPYSIDPGEGVFYGPKIDIKIKDVLGRSWQCSTVQVDFNNPERFKLEYTGEDGHAHKPIMIHRALMGSIERFFGILVEHYAGAFPTWLAPVQALVISITDKHKDYADALAKRLGDAGFRVEADLRSEKMGFKVREAERAKIPYMLVVGDREIENGEVSIRRRGGINAGSQKIETFVDLLTREVQQRDLHPAIGSEPVLKGEVTNRSSKAEG